jgi:hypothetical protein
MSKLIKKSGRKPAELDQSNLKKIAAAMKTEMASVPEG